LRAGYLREEKELREAVNMIMLEWIVGRNEEYVIERN
jgi:hypothetical protein